MFILLLRIFFSFFPGIAAVLGFTSICISIVSVDCLKANEAKKLLDLKKLHEAKMDNIMGM